MKLFVLHRVSVGDKKKLKAVWTYHSATSEQSFRVTETKYYALLKQP